MSLKDDKRKVFTTIGSYTSFMEQNKPFNPTDVFPSINNKKDVVPFLLDTLKNVAGSDKLKELVGGMITKLVASGETKMKEVLKKQFVQSNSGDLLPTGFTTNGLDVKVKDIDVAGKFKTDPTSDVGSLLYQKKFDVDKLFHDAIRLENTSVSFGGLNLNVIYNDATDSFNFKPSGVTNIGDYFTNFIDKTQLLDSNEVVANVMDTIYGTLKAKSKKTQAEILQELEVQKVLEQITNGDDSMTILPRDYEELQRNALELSQGIVNYDLGCGLMPASLSFTSLNNLNILISGSTDTFLVGNAIESTIGESTTGNTETTSENIETIKDGFFQKLIKIFTTQMLYAGTQQPQIKMLLTMMKAFQDNGVVVSQAATEYMKQFKVFIHCMVKEILMMIAEYIFLLAVGYMIKLLTPVIKKILKEKINQFLQIIKSLTAGSKVLAAISP